MNTLALRCLCTGSSKIFRINFLLPIIVNIFILMNITELVLTQQRTIFDAALAYSL